jgi:hypothetical protein
MLAYAGYYKRTPDKYLDFEGVHPWSNTQDRQNKDTLNYQGQTLPRDVADEDFGKQLDSNTDEGHLPGKLCVRVCVCVCVCVWIYIMTSNIYMYIYNFIYIDRCIFLRKGSIPQYTNILVY